jgi:hypothetical protein
MAALIGLGNCIAGVSRMHPSKAASRLVADNAAALTLAAVTGDVVFE